MWPYPWTHVGTPSHLGHMDRVAATMPSQAHAGAAQEAPDIGQWEGQDVPLVRPSSCNVKRGTPSSRRYLPTYLPLCGVRQRHPRVPAVSRACNKAYQDRKHWFLTGLCSGVLVVARYMGGKAPTRVVTVVHPMIRRVGTRPGVGWGPLASNPPGNKSIQNIESRLPSLWSYIAHSQSRGRDCLSSG